MRAHLMQPLSCMGTARSGRDRRDLSKYETVFEDPDYERLRAFASARRQARVTTAAFAGGSALEAIGGLAAVICSIIGFSFLPFHMASVATIAVGIALFAQGSAVMARWRDALQRLQGEHFDRQELVGGLSTEVFGGIVGIVLGVLALANVKPLVMLPVAAIVFGGALMLGGAAQPELVYLAPERNPKVARVTYNAILTSGGVMILVGIASAVLGILGVLSIGPILTTTLAALMAIGGSLTFAGGALSARFTRRLRQA
jgi:hypothetical protein